MGLSSDLPVMASGCLQTWHILSVVWVSHPAKMRASINFWVGKKKRQGRKCLKMQYIPDFLGKFTCSCFLNWVFYHYFLAWTQQCSMKWDWQSRLSLKICFSSRRGEVSFVIFCPLEILLPPTSYLHHCMDRLYVLWLCKECIQSAAG